MQKALSKKQGFFNFLQKRYNLIMDYKYNAIILGSREIGETDRVYSFLTKESGKVRAIGRGTRKPIAKLAGNLEPLSLVEIFLSKSKGLGNISGVIPLENFVLIKNNIEALSEVLAVFKILEKILQEDQREEKIYSYLESFLLSIEKSLQEKKEVDYQFLKVGLMFKIFEELGYRLEVGNCAECGKKLISGENYFDFSRGGVVCRICNQGKVNGVAISDDSIKAIRIVLSNKIENLVKLKINEREKKKLENIFKTFYRWTWN